jgi:hypothetical protein
MNRFVRPEVVRLQLSGGDFIDVKKELNTGESRRVFARMARDMTPGENVKLDPQQVGMAKVVEYLIGWSFTDEDGRPVPLPESPEMKEAVISNLHIDTWNEIRLAVDEHEERVDAQRAQEKKVPTIESSSKTTSPSPSDVTGRTNTSVN